MLNSFYKLQLDLLNSIELLDLSPKGLLRQGRNLLILYKKANQFREDKHWKLVREICLQHINVLPSIIGTHLSTLSPEEESLLIGFAELANSCAIIMFEEEDEIVLAPEVKPEQIEALKKLYGNL